MNEAAAHVRSKCVGPCRPGSRRQPLISKASILPQPTNASVFIEGAGGTALSRRQARRRTAEEGRDIIKPSTPVDDPKAQNRDNQERCGDYCQRSAVRSRPSFAS